ncbi:MAG: peptide ABC transporter permease [Epulopiscium sp. Nele67-Bin004]|nr:MAG: peptide ABC transporter permease [Epulopiscium sp. Nele67-Bin004]
MPYTKSKLQKAETQKLWVKNLKKFWSNKLAVVGLVFMVIIVLATICAPILTSYDPETFDLTSTNLPPSADHPFGTDQLGRDVLSRVLYGGRASIFISVCGAILSTIIGVVLGSISGYYGKWIDAFLLKTSEMFQMFPQLILIFILVSLLGPGLYNLLIIFTITGWMTTYRMVRNEFLSLREETYVEVAKAFGMSDTWIIFKEILPNALSPVIVATTVNIAGFILQEASLSFLGVGVPASSITWGNILTASKSIDAIINYWWIWLVPAVMISVFVLSINFFGDGLRDMLDPKQQ